MTQFNFGQLPINSLPDDSLIHLNNAIVAVGAQSLTDDATYLSIHNDGHLYESLHMLRSSVMGTRAATISELGHWFKRYPHLRTWSGNALTMQPVHDAFETQRIASITDCIKFVQALNESNPDGPMAQSKSVIASKLTDDNISQVARHDALMARPWVAESWNRIMRRMLDWCVEHHYRLEFRQAVSFPSRYYDTLRATSSARGLQNPELYYSPSMSAAVDNLPMEMSSRIAAHDMHPHAGLKLFQAWDKCVGTMRLIPLEDNGSPIYVLTAHDVPNVWLGDCVDYLPVGISSAKSYLPFDQVKGYINWHPEDGHQPLIEARRLNSSPDMHRGGDLLMILGALLSIYASTPKTGKGYMKPSWVHSPINSMMIENTRLIARAYAGAVS